MHSDGEVLSDTEIIRIDSMKSSTNVSYISSGSNKLKKSSSHSDYHDSPDPTTPTQMRKIEI